MAHARAGCYVCLRGDRLVDTGAFIEGEGALALCAGCIREAAEAADLTFNEARVAEISSAFAEERRSFGPERVAELEAELAAATSALAVSHAIEERLVDAFNNRPAGVTEPDPAVPAPESE